MAGTTAEDASVRDHALLELVSNAQSDFIAHKTRQQLFATLLQGLLKITDIETAFIGEPAGQDSIVLPICVVTRDGCAEDPDIETWNKKLRPVLQLRAPLLTPTLLALPLCTPEGLTGIVALTGRRSVEDHALVDSLMHLSVTCGHLLQAYRTKAEQVEAEREIKKLAEIARRTSNAVCLTDRNARIEWVNEGFSRLTGYSLAEVRGRIPGALLQGPDTDPETVRRMQTALRQRQGFHVELLNYAKDGRTYWVDIEVQPIVNESGEVTHYMAIETDITERRCQEQALREALEQAEAATAAKAQFLANMSHEIRTPLTAIIGFADALREPGLHENECAQGLRSISNNGRHLLGLINDILDLSKIDADAMKVECVYFSPILIMEEVRTMMAGRLADKPVSLAFEYDWPIPEMIKSDPLRFKQILINLTGNAIKFTERGQVAVRLKWQRETGMLQVSVADSGIGIDPSQIPNLFRPFSQGDSSMSRRFGGTGLGLSISARLVERLGGSIGVESALNSGSTFKFDIPTGAIRNVLLLQAMPQAAPASQRRPAVQHHTLKGRILVADDAPENQKLIAFLLRKTGLSTTFVTDGRQALRAAADTSFDLILMDMQMPVMDGYTATRELRKRGITVPIVALTANAMKQELTKCLEAGCTTHLPKPFENEEFFRLLHRFLHAAPPSAALAALTSTALVDDPEMLHLIRDFVRSQGNRIDEARGCLATADFQALKETGHRLQGSGGLYGYRTLALLGSALETAAAGQEAEQIVHLLDEWSRLHEKMADGLPAEDAR